MFYQNIPHKVFLSLLDAFHSQQLEAKLDRILLPRKHIQIGLHPVPMVANSTPSAVMQYVTNPEKAAHVSVQNLFEDEDYAEQFTETMRRFNKGKKYDERKYYHFKLSCDRKDNVSPEEAHRFAEKLTARLFPDCECVIATHTDTQTVHSHIVVNALNPLTGKKLRISRNDYTAMKDETNRLGAEMGFSEIDFRKRSEHKRTAEERHIILKGGTS